MQLKVSKSQEHSTYMAVVATSFSPDSNLLKEECLESYWQQDTLLHILCRPHVGQIQLRFGNLSEKRDIFLLFELIWGFSQHFNKKMHILAGYGLNGLYISRYFKVQFTKK